MTDIATLGIAVDSTQVRRGVSDLDGLAAAGGRAEKSVQSLGGVVGALARGMGVLTGALATVGISRLITETATLSQRYNEMGIVLNVVSRNAGLLKSDVDAVTKAVKDQGISMIESRSVMTRLIQAQIDLSKATELARLAQDAAVIGQINSSEALDRMIHGITSAQVEVLRGIGINVNFENSYKQLAQQMGVATSSLSEQQKMQARVNIVLEEATKLNGVYAASMENAGKQMRSTQRLAEDLKVKIGGLFDQTAMVAVKAYTDLLKDLDRTVEDMARSGELKDWSHRIAIEFAGLIDITRVFIGQFGIIGNLVATQFTNIKNGDFDKLTLGFANADKALKALWADGEKYQDQVNSRVIQENMLTEAVGRGAAAAQKKSEEETKGALGLKDRKSEQDKLNKAQQEALRTESEYIKLLEIERKQRQDLIAPYKEGAKQAADRLNSMQDEIAALKLVRDRQIGMKQAVELTTIARLEEKKAKATDSLVLKEIEAEIAARRKVIDLIPEYERLEKQSRNAANTVSQQWIQAGRNIQSALSSSIFDFFNDGLDGMVRSLKSALLRMLAEAASLRFSESIGSLLLGGSGGAGGVGGTGGQTTGLLASLLGAFGGAGGGIRTGGGVTTGAFSNAGGAGTAFIGGPGTAIGGSGLGVNATRGAGMGSSLMGMAAMAGPYGMIAAATIMAGMELNKKYGDYKVSGFNKFGMNGLNKTDPIAVIANQFGIKGPGEIIGKALFGRGPYKFRQQSIQGDISAGGLDGTITDVFKSKGGLLVKNKHKEFEKDIPSEIVRDIDKSIKSIYKSTGEFADNLGIDARSIDTFTKQIQLKSEKGKALDTEKVKEELDAFNEDLIKSFMPDIDNFKLTGESAGETFKRLNNELDALKTGVQNLGGSAEFAKELIMGMSIDARSAVVDIAGGIDKLLEKTQFFSENFLTPTEQIAPTIAMVNEEMAKLGFSSVTTKDQFRELVQSMEIPAETRNALLDIAPAFLQILDAAKQIKAEANDNLLTLAQEFAPQLVIGLQRDMANEVLGKFGVTVDTSREKVTELLTAFVKSGGLFSNMAGDVMEAANAWVEFQQLLPAKTPATPDAPTKEVIDPMKQLASAYSALQRSVDAERKKITDKYNIELGKVNTSIDNLTGSVGKLKSLSDSLKNAVDQIQPLTRGQAKFELLSAINNAKRGIFPEANDLQKVLNVLSDSNSITDAKSSFEFAREQAKTSLLMQDLGDLTDNQLSVEEKMLVAAEKQRDDLNRNFQDQTLRLDSMLTKAQEQIDKLSGIDTRILSLSQALANFSKAYSAASAPPMPEVVTPPSAGNPKITNKEIVDYARAPGRTEMEIYNKAKEVGVSFEQYAKATGSNVEDLYAWAKKKGLPTFASGGYHQGGLRIVGEKGPELEYTGPSRIISNADVSKLGGNDDLSREIKALAEKVGKTQQSLEKVVSIFNKVIVDDKGAPALSIKQRTA